MREGGQREAHGVQVRAEAEDLEPFVGAQRVVDHELQPQAAARRHAGDERGQPELRKRVEAPTASGEDAMEGGVLPGPCSATDHQAFGDGVALGAQHPGRRHQEPACEGRCSESGAKDFQRTQERASTVLGHGASDR